VNGRRAIVNDCWNTIGVRGDSSCAELTEHVHCRNCPVYANAAVNLLEVELPSDYLAQWTRHVAQSETATEVDTHSVIVFRVDGEWLALSTDAFKEIASVRPIHSIPHRRDGVVLGLVNIRGELVVCVSLRQILGMETAAERKRGEHRLDERMLVVERDGSRTVFPVDGVHAIRRYNPRELSDVPATIAKATASYTKAMLSWQNKSVGILDDQLLFYTLKRRFVSATAT
jgi:chemotaxis-related protein WspD